jgi:hypothetical protein
MPYAYELDEDVLHHSQGPQGRVRLEEPIVYTIVQRLPIEADGRLRYRIKGKSKKIERVATEDQLSCCRRLGSQTNLSGPSPWSAVNQ